MKHARVDVTVYLLTASVLAFVLASPALYFASRKATLFLPDYAALVMPFAIWALLLRMDEGRIGFSRWIVPMALAIASPLVLTFRVVVLDILTAAPAMNAVVAFGVCCALPLMLHRMLPHLPADREESSPPQVGYAPGVWRLTGRSDRQRVAVTRGE